MSNFAYSAGIAVSGFCAYSSGHTELGRTLIVLAVVTYVFLTAYDRLVDPYIKDWVM